MALPDTLEVYVHKAGHPTVHVVTHRNMGPPPETDSAFLDRHCAEILAAFGDPPIPTSIENEDMGILTEYEVPWTATDFVRAYKEQVEASQ